MKYLQLQMLTVSVMLFSLSFSTVAQDLSFMKPMPVDSVTHTVTYTGIDTVPGTKSEIASKAYWWWATTHLDEDEYIHYADLAGGRFVGHGFIRVKDIDSSAPADLYVWYTLYFQANAGRYKYTFTDFSVISTFYYSSKYFNLAFIHTELEKKLEKKLKQQFEESEQQGNNFYKDIYKKLDVKLKEIITSMQVAIEKGEDW